MSDILIRPGTRADVPRAFELIQELAEYEKAAEQVTTTVQKMEEDGFGPNPVYGLLVAEDGEKGVVGIALYYYRYSTWKGKRIYLEDLIVTEAARGRGVGKALLQATIQTARDTNCTGLMWQVLDWNEPAIEFYKRFDVRFDEGWINCHVDF